MTTRFNNWKRWFLIPFLCILLALAGGCGGTGSSDSGDRQDRQELQKIEAAAENPAAGEFDDLQETDADEGGDSYDPESDYGGEETDSRDSGSGEIVENGVYTTKEDVPFEDADELAFLDCLAYSDLNVEDRAGHRCVDRSCACCGCGSGSCGCRCGSGSSFNPWSMTSPYSIWPASLSSTLHAYPALVLLESYHQWTL